MRESTWEILTFLIPGLIGFAVILLAVLAR